MIIINKSNNYECSPEIRCTNCAHAVMYVTYGNCTDISFTWALHTVYGSQHCMHLPSMAFFLQRTQYSSGCEPEFSSITWIPLIPPSHLEDCLVLGWGIHVVENKCCSCEDLPRSGLNLGTPS